MFSFTKRWHFWAFMTVFTVIIVGLCIVAPKAMTARQQKTELRDGAERSLEHFRFVVETYRMFTGHLPTDLRQVAGQSCEAEDSFMEYDRSHLATDEGYEYRLTKLSDGDYAIVGESNALWKTVACIQPRSMKISSDGTLTRL